MPELRVIECRGSARQIGQIHGESCREDIKRLIDQLLTTLGEWFGERTEKYLAGTIAYMPFVKTYPHLLEEITGLAEGAGITMEEALFLQCRGEFLFGKLPECTSFAAAGSATVGNAPLAGQNFDLDPVDEFVIVLRIMPQQGPDLMFLTVAGVIGYGGLNSDGLVVNLNLVRSPGWRAGLPAYLITRLALEQPDASRAAELVTRTYRASSRNYLFTDLQGTIIDVETTVDEWAILKPGKKGWLVHANHFVDSKLKLQDSGVAEWPDSIQRQVRMEELIRSVQGEFSPDLGGKFLKDHAHSPKSICRHLDQSLKPAKTVASIISLPSEGAVLALAGNPCSEGRVRIEFE